MIKLTDILSEVLNEDRCKRIADRKYDKPSAYKSGAIVRCRDGKIWKDIKEDESLHKWFKRQGAPGKSGGWVDCNTCRNVDGKKKCKACGRQKGEKRSKYPSCRPTPSQCSDPGKGKKWGKTNESEINREKIFPYTYEGKKRNDIEDSKKIMYLYRFKSDKHSYSVRFIKDGKGIYERSFTTDDKNLGSTDENIPYKIYRTVTAITLDFLELANKFGDFQELVIEPISRERNSMVNTFITSYIAPKYKVNKDGASVVITNK